MARTRTYTDSQLIAAVAASTSWRGTLRELGLASSSASEMRSVRTHADRLNIDYMHFNSHPRSREGGGHRTSSASGALEGAAPIVSTVDTVSTGVDLAPDRTRLRRAGALLAAAWYTMCGQDVSWPLEPARYDLSVHCAGVFRRVQVKTTVARAGESWKAYISTSRRGRTTYSADEIDEFFIIDGDLGMYIIPVDDVAGLHALHLRGYERYKQAAFIPSAALPAPPLS